LLLDDASLAEGVRSSGIQSNFCITPFPARNFVGLFVGLWEKVELFKLLNINSIFNLFDSVQGTNSPVDFANHCQAGHGPDDDFALKTRDWNGAED